MIHQPVLSGCSNGIHAVVWLMGIRKQPMIEDKMEG